MASLPGKVYVHCFLGRHRVKRVQDLLERRGTVSGTYRLRQGERSAEAMALDRADAAFRAGDYGGALEIVEGIRKEGTDAEMLAGWCHYRLGEIDAAERAFAHVLRGAPGHGGAETGLGYCELRRDRSARAEGYFKSALRSNREDASAAVGLGLALYRQDRLAEAERWLTKGLAVGPRDAEAQEVLDRIRSVLGRVGLEKASE